MFVIMVDTWVHKKYSYSDYITAEYSGVHHTTRESAEAELYELKLYNIDNETLKNAYIEEV